MLVSNICNINIYINEKTIIVITFSENSLVSYPISLSLNSIWKFLERTTHFPCAEVTRFGWHWLLGRALISTHHPLFFLPQWAGAQFSAIVSWWPPVLLASWPKLLQTESISELPSPECVWCMEEKQSHSKPEIGHPPHYCLYHGEIMKGSRFYIKLHWQKNREQVKS